MTRRRTGRGRGVLDDLQHALTSVHRPTVLTTLWRWRYEMLLPGGASIFEFLLIGAVGGFWTIAVNVGVIGAVSIVARLRQLLMSRLFVIVVQHRIRVAFEECWINSRSGRIPAVLWASARPYGERVILWCPVGISVEDLKSVDDDIAAACWATFVLVEKNSRNPQIVSLHIVRRASQKPRFEPYKRWGVEDDVASEL
jgi:hypothetical protein